MYAFVNDAFVPLENAVVPVTDLALNRGYGVFDFLKTINGKPIFLAEHLDRFYQSAAGLRLPVAFAQEELSAIIEELMQRNSLTTSGIKLLLTGGASEDGYRIGKPNLVITQQAILLPGDEAFTKGIKLASVAHQRQLPAIKTIDYLMPIWLQNKLAEQDADDLLYHQSGIISECPRANFFIVTADNKLVTPQDNILEGITLRKVLEIARRFVDVEERPVTLQEAQQAKEAFVTSTTKLILPVTAIDGRPINTGRNKITTVLYNALQEQLQDSIASKRSSIQRMR